MTDYHETVRTAGPMVLSEGPVGGTTVLVLDPAGIGKHGELPPTWQPITEVLRVVWCRLPAAHFDANEVSALLDEVSGTTVHLVTSGRVVTDVLSLAREASESVRSVFLVDPEPDADSLAGPIGMARAGGIEVRTIAENRDPAEDIGVDPLPLGHPAVVRELTPHLL